MKVGIMGISPGNGHPFSFSSIVNGYSDQAYAHANWDVIHNYLRARKPDEFGYPGVQVTHAWTQDPLVTKLICECSKIGQAVSSPEDMLGKVDALLVARDDQSSHWALANPYLKAGVPVFVDKPLSTSPEELRAFMPYLESGQLMSCSGMRYAKELDDVRRDPSEYGEMKLIRGAILNEWEVYGVHLIDAAIGAVPARPVSVEALGEGNIMSARFAMNDGSILHIDALGKVAKVIRLDFIGTKKFSSHDLFDNFSMFRRLLGDFFLSVREKRPAIPAADVLCAMRALIAARISKAERRRVSLDEIRI